MQHVGNVISLYISQKGTAQTLEKEHLSVDKEGIIGDKHHGKDAERSVLITSTESYALVKREAIDIPYGTLGENLLIDYNPYHLSPGSRLQIGDATLEITQNCTLCKHLAVHDKRIPKLLKDDRGIFAKVVKAGHIKTGDPVSLV